MARRGSKKQPDGTKPVKTYRHPKAKLILRPEVGVQAQFKKKKPAKVYRFDSSLAPDLNWDGQNPAREYGQWLLKMIEEAAGLPQPHQFKDPVEYKDASGRIYARVIGLHDAIDQLKRLERPFLNWAGKAERLSFKVPTLPLFVHERLSTKAILETLKGHKRDKQMDFDLFGDPQHPIHEQALKAYEHQNGWVNRMILGDSLVVVNSLLEYESLGGQVQMIYMDPPYGINYGSNFQPFVRKRDVKHGDDEDMTREPEMVKAYRDTWELGVHSYLTYLRDRFLLCRDLLHPSGSIFVQINDERLHHVQELMDETFGRDNCIAVIPFKKTSGQASKFIAGVCDFLLWYARDKRPAAERYSQLYASLGADISDESYNCIELDSGKWRRLTAAEVRGEVPMPAGRRFRTANLTSQGASEVGSAPFEFEGRVFRPSPGTHWKPGTKGLPVLRDAGRLVAVGNTLAYKRYIDDFPVVALNNVWSDTVESTFAVDKFYAVQTSSKVIERCISMATRPGDLVLDPTCGGGTTARAAEAWGRRWITVDVSRVPLALARQRLLTATYECYELKETSMGPAGGVRVQKKTEQERPGGWWNRAARYPRVDCQRRSAGRGGSG